jgi:hypothetical protein
MSSTVLLNKKFRGIAVVIGVTKRYFTFLGRTKQPAITSLNPS